MLPSGVIISLRARITKKKKKKNQSPGGWDAAIRGRSSGFQGIDSYNSLLPIMWPLYYRLLFFSLFSLLSLPSYFEILRLVFSFSSLKWETISQIIDAKTRIMALEKGNRDCKKVSAWAFSARALCVCAWVLLACFVLCISPCWTLSGRIPVLCVL